MKYYLLQGFFYQGTSELGIGFKPGDGEVATVRHTLLPFMYSGAIWHLGHEPLNELVGALTDDMGPSDLYDIQISDTVLSFSKFYRKYQGDPAKFVRYEFGRSAENTWFGTYSFPTTPDVPGGTSRCILTPINGALIQEDVDRAGLAGSRARKTARSRKT